MIVLAQSFYITNIMHITADKKTHKQYRLWVSCLQWFAASLASFSIISLLLLSFQSFDQDNCASPDILQTACTK